MCVCVCVSKYACLLWPLSLIALWPCQLWKVSDRCVSKCSKWDRLGEFNVLKMLNTDTQQELRASYNKSLVPQWSCRAPAVVYTNYIFKVDLIVILLHRTTEQNVSRQQGEQTVSGWVLSFKIFGLCADISLHWCHWCSVDGTSDFLGSFSSCFYTGQQAANLAILLGARSTDLYRGQ